ncbi:hypothetical protein [Xanthomonas albilineans]|uniref:hypothetical protein n=1 Tax=Xanthomonas albilineans TaxID=29447 RepID=UPI0012D45786|nr:hypothetical protein [Xanthomonas albilineans]
MKVAARVGHSGSAGFNVGGQYDFSEHEHLLFSVGLCGLLYGMDASAVNHPTTYYLAYQWTF